jgi:hypothetical protein
MRVRPGLEVEAPHDRVDGMGASVLAGEHSFIARRVRDRAESAQAKKSPDRRPPPTDGSCPLERR